MLTFDDIAENSLGGLQYLPPVGLTVGIGDMLSDNHDNACNAFKRTYVGTYVLGDGFVGVLALVTAPIALTSAAIVDAGAGAHS